MFSKTRAARISLGPFRRPIFGHVQNCKQQISNLQEKNPNSNN